MIKLSPALRPGLRRGRADPAAFRQQLQQLGPTFIKVGQFLALRPDLIPEEYSDELMHLLDQVPPFPWEQARAIIRADLLVEPEELFATIDPTPIGSGSLAQTHAARLHSGAEVVVKVQRPGLREAVMRDLGRARLLTRLLESSGVAWIVSPQEVVRELTEWLLREIDFGNELANVTRLHQLAADSPIQKIPRPYPHLCSGRVVTVELLRGAPLSRLLRAPDDHGPAARERGWPNTDHEQLAANLITACLTQIFRYEFFHADLHPGNLLAMPENVVGFVDFGLCDELHPTIRERLTRYVAAVFSNDAEQMFSALTEILVPGPEVDMSAFRRDFLIEVRSPPPRRPPLRSGRAQVRADRERSPIAQGMIGVMRIARQHRLSLPPRILTMYRALLTAETVAYQLGADVDLRSVGRGFFSRLELEQTLRSLRPEKLQSLGLSLLTLGRDAPGQVQQLLTELTDGRFTLNVYVSEAPRITRNRNQRTGLIVSALLSVGVALLLTRPDLPVLLGVSLVWPLLALLLGLYVWIALQWRNL